MKSSKKNLAIQRTELKLANKLKLFKTHGINKRVKNNFKNLKLSNTLELSKKLYLKSIELKMS